MSSKPNWIGRFDRDHIARLSFTLHSPSGKSSATYEGIIDTGLTGFVQVPASVGTALGFLTPPLAVGNTHLANGATQQVLLKQSKVYGPDRDAEWRLPNPLDPQQPSTLIGMDFLRRFERLLIVSSRLGIHLVPEQSLPQFSSDTSV